MRAQGQAERNVIQRRIAATDRQIDGLVDELYGLTDEEIKIVEEAMQGRQLRSMGFEVDAGVYQRYIGDRSQSCRRSTPAMGAQEQSVVDAS